MFSSSFRGKISILATIFVFLLVPTPGRAGEGGPKSEKAAESKTVKSKKSCFTLLNAKEIPADASIEQRLALARLDVHVEGRTFEEIVTDFGKVVGVPVIVLPSECDENVGDCGKNDLDGTIHGISARSYLDYLFYVMDIETGYSWIIREEKIILPQETFRSDGPIVTRVYKMDSIFDPTKQKQEWDDFGYAFAELVTDTVLADSRNDYNTGSIDPLLLPGAKALVVRDSTGNQKKVAALIDAFKQMLSKKETTACIALDESARKRFCKAMNRKVTLNCKKTPLADVVSMIEKQIEMPMLVDWQSLEEIGLSGDVPITYQCKDRSLRGIEKELFCCIESKCTSRFDAIWLTTQEQARWVCGTTLFEVTDLVKGPGDSNFDSDGLMFLIVHSIDDGSWDNYGGPGQISDVIVQGRVFLVVNQTADVMGQVEQFLVWLREIKEGKVKSCPQPTNKDRQLLKKLARRADWNVEKGTQLADFFKELKQRHGIENWIDRWSLEDIGYSLDSSIGPIQVKDCSVGAILDILLDPMELAWCVEDGRVLVSTDESLSTRSVKIYEVSDLVVFEDTQGNRYHDFDTLIYLIMSAVDPCSWDEGGRGNISEWSFCNRNVIVFDQMSQVHQEVGKLLADLRATRPKDPAKRKMPVRVYPLTGVRRDGFGRMTTKDDPFRKFLENLPPPHSGEGKLVESNNAFAMKLYKQMARQQNEIGDEPEKEGHVVRNKSFCFSPFGIASLSQAIKEGVGGRTNEELRKATCLTLADKDLHGAHGSLIASILTRRTKDEKAGPFYFTRPLQLAVANRLWLQKEKDIEVSSEFERKLDEYYLCDAVATNLTGKPILSAKHINKWIRTQTRGKIDKIISHNDINNETRFVAVNAVSFKGTWVGRLSLGGQLEPFYDSDSRTEIGKVPMMWDLKVACWFGEVDGVSIFRKAYDGDASFVLLLPPVGEGELEKLEASLSIKKLHQWMEAARPFALWHLELPKFTIQSDFSLVDAMKQLGVKELFCKEGADFSNMFFGDQNPFLVNFMHHKAMIEVDEIGTDAFVTTKETEEFDIHATSKVKEFTVNRPFLFMVIDDKTSSILFMGRYMGPEKNKVSQVDTIFQNREQKQ